MAGAARAALIALLLAGCDQARGADAVPGTGGEERVHVDAHERARRVIAGLPAEPDDGLTVPTPIEDPSGHALDALHRALARAARGEGRARLVFYGGSHTASDLYTGEIRARLQGEFGDAGHGFVLVQPPIDRYWQWGARVIPGDGWDEASPDPKRMGIEPYGLTGIAFDAIGDAWARVETERAPASRLELAYLAQPGGGSVEITVDSDVHVIRTEAASARAAVHVVAVPDGQHAMELRTLGDGPVRLFGVALEREQSGVIVDQLGLAGAKARHMGLWDEEVWSALLAWRRPDLIALSYGNNEGDDHHLTLDAHVRHFEAAIERVQRHFPEASCLVIAPSDRQLDEGEGWHTPELIHALHQAQRRIARERGCAFFDTIAWQGGPGAVERWIAAEPPLERDDRIHFTELGYRRFGRALVRGLLEGL